jgi:hypothetical protein
MYILKRFNLVQRELRKSYSTQDGLITISSIMKHQLFGRVQVMSVSSAQNSFDDAYIPHFLVAFRD